MGRKRHTSTTSRKPKLTILLAQPLCIVFACLVPEVTPIDDIRPTLTLNLSLLAYSGQCKAMRSKGNHDYHASGPSLATMLQPLLCNAQLEITPVILWTNNILDSRNGSLSAMSCPSLTTHHFQSQRGSTTTTQPPY